METLRHLLTDAAVEVAPRLLGCLLKREVNGRMLTGKIVETEAYDQTDLASHSYRGKTKRTEVMFGPPGRLYVYFTYGMHYCCNVVTGPIGHGSAVLIRALEPLEGQATMSLKRGGLSGERLTNGPAKLCQALMIDSRSNGHDLNEPPLQLVLQPPIPSDTIIQTTRVGISKVQDARWRFYIKANPYVSKK